MKPAQKFMSPGIGCYQPPPLPAAAPLPTLRFTRGALVVSFGYGILIGVLVTTAVHGWL